MYETIQALRNGTIVTLDGIQLKAVDKPIEVGDLYVAERNTGPHLLTAKHIDERGWIQPTTAEYSFDTNECVPVEEAK